MKSLLKEMFCTVHGLRTMNILLVIWIVVIAVTHYRQMVEAQETVHECLEKTLLFVSHHGNVLTRLDEQLKLQEAWYLSALAESLDVNMNAIGLTMLKDHINDKIPLSQSEVKRIIRLMKDSKEGIRELGSSTEVK